jgi:tetratricopeptide (TPR) repeat protein
LLFNAAQQYWVASEKQSSQTFQDKALALYQRYLETKPQGATAEVSQEKFFEVAEARWSAGDRERAEELYRRYLELAPGGGSRDVVTARVEEMEAQRAAAKAAEEEAARERAEAEAARAEDAAKKRAEEEAAKEDTKKDVARTEGAERDPRAALRRWPAWVEYAVLGTGAGLIAGGGLMHWRAEVNGDSYDAEIAARCPRGCLSDQIPSVTEKLSKAETQSKLATTGYIVGGLAVAAGVVMYRIGEREPGESRAGASAAIVTPMVTGEVMGGVISLRF